MKCKSFYYLVALLITSIHFSYAEQRLNNLNQHLESNVNDEIQLHKININQATADELAKNLTGIGLAKARKIVEYREKLGHFISIEQLKEVSGIGQSILDKNKSIIIF